MLDEVDLFFFCMAIYLFAFCESSVPTVMCSVSSFLLGHSSDSFKSEITNILTFFSDINFVFFPLCHLPFNFVFHFRNVAFLSSKIPCFVLCDFDKEQQ